MTASLSADVRRYLASVAIARFGTGLTLPFTLILLHEVRDIALPTVGLLLAVPGVVGLAAVPVSGALVDRLGPRTVLATCMALQSAGALLLAVVTSPPAALAALLLLGIGIGPSFPAGNALLSGLVTGPGASQRAFGLQFTVLNAAIGVGTLVGAVVADVERALTFEALFVTAAACYLAQAVMLPAAARPVRLADDEAPSYREVWQDRAFRKLCLVSLLFAMTGYAALDAGMPAYARVVGGASTATIALAFTANTVLIVSLQLPVLKVIRRWRHTQALAVAAVTWAVSWALLGLSQATGAVLLFGVLFGLGEVFMAPALQPLVNGLASDRLRGRYNALSGAMFSIAFVASPALSGFLIGNGLGRVWIGGLVAGSVVSAVVALRLREQLTDEQDGLEVRAPVPG